MLFETPPMRDVISLKSLSSIQGPFKRRKSLKRPPRIESTSSFIATKVIEGLLTQYFPEKIKSLTSVSEIKLPKAERQAALVENLIKRGCPLKEKTLESILKHLSKSKKKGKYSHLGSYPALFRVNTSVKNCFIEVHSPRDMAIIICNRENKKAFVSSGEFKTIYYVWPIKQQILLAAAVSNLSTTPRSLQKVAAREEVFLNLFNGKTGTTKLLRTTYYETGEQVLLMHYYPNTLYQLVEDHNKINAFSFEERLNMAAGLARTFAYVHQNEVAHRDVKPENVLVDGSEAFLTDFGLSCRIDDFNSVNEICGSPHYISYEMMDMVVTNITNCKRYPQANDVWGLACLLWLIFADNHLFPWFSDIKTRDFSAAMSRLKVLRQDHRPLFEGSLYALIWEMLELDPTKRITSDKVSERLTAMQKAPHPRERFPERINLHPRRRQQLPRSPRSAACKSPLISAKE